MAKVKGGLFSNEARGGFGKAINFRMLATGGIASQYREKNKSNSPAQAERKTRYKAGCEAWRGLTTEQKNGFNARARVLSINGFNLFMREALTMAQVAAPTVTSMTFNGQTGEIINNVSGIFTSIEKIQTGIFKVNFSRPAGMVGTSYEVFASAQDDNAFVPMCYEQGSAGQYHLEDSFRIVGYGFGVALYDFTRIKILMSWG